MSDDPLSRAHQEIERLLYENEQLRKEKNDIHRELRTAENECSMLRVECGVMSAERDEARRMVCEWHGGLRVQHPQDYAKRRGWDCYKEDSQ